MVDSPEAMGPDERLPRAREDVVFRQLTDEWVLYDAESRQMHVVNTVGAMVWAACDGETTVAALAGELRATFAEPPDERAVIADISETLARFRTEGLLQ